MQASSQDSRSLQSIQLYNVTHGGGWNRDESNQLVSPLPNGVYRHYLIATDDTIRPENKLNMTLYLELRVHSIKFRVTI